MEVTYDRAMEVFTYGSPNVEEVIEVNRMAFDALKRLNPTKLRQRKMFYPICPCCGRTVEKDGKPKHCVNCGQALLWED